MSKYSIAFQGAYLLLLQALIEITDDPALSEVLKSRNTANHAKRLMECLLRQTEKVYKYKEPEVGEQMFQGARVLVEFATKIQLVDFERIPELDQELEALFARYIPEKL